MIMNAYMTNPMLQVSLVLAGTSSLEQSFSEWHGLRVHCDIIPAAGGCKCIVIDSV